MNMKHRWKKYLKKRVACLLCAALMFGCVPANGSKAVDEPDVSGQGGVTLQVEGQIVNGNTVRLKVKNTDAFEEIPADLQEHIVYQWFLDENEGNLDSINYSDEGESYDLKGTDLNNGNVCIQVRAIYGGPTDGLNGVYPYGESCVLKVKDGSLEVDALAGVTVRGSGKGAKNGSIEIDPSINELQYYYQEFPEDVKDFDNWKLEGLSEDTEIGVKYKKEVMAGTTILNELYAVYAIPVDESWQPTASPSAEPDFTDRPEPTEEPGNTTEPTKEPEVTKEPTKAPEITKEPEVTQEPTKVPEVTREPEVTQKPTKKPEVTKEPGITAEPTKEPDNTKEPADTAKPSPTDMSKPGTVATVGNAVYKSNGSGSVSYDGVKTDKKTVSVPDKVTVGGKSYPVTKISAGAFSGSKVQNVKLGSNVKTIGKKAFKNCKSLKKIAFSNKTTKVDSESFSGCAKLASVSLPASVKTVGAKEFKNCKKLKKFKLGKTPVKTKKGNVMFGAVGGKKVAIGASALENCLNLRSVIINSQVTKIGNNTFRNCKKLASMLVKSLKLKTVGNRALKGVSHCKISVPTIRLKKYRTLFTNKGQGKKVVIAKV